MISTRKLVYKIVERLADSQLALAAHPVGSYYETSDSSFDPNVSWGGTWELEASGKVHVSAGTGYAVGDSGGAATHTHSTANHTLTVSEIPSHSHTMYGKYSTGTGSASGYVQSDNRTVTTVSSGNTGGGGAHNHGNTGSASTMPPYIVVNRWHRTA